MKTIKEIFQDHSGHLSSKRILGAFGMIVVLYMAILHISFSVTMDHVVFASLCGLVGGLLGIGTFERGEK